MQNYLEGWMDIVELSGGMNSIELSGGSIDNAELSGRLD